MPIDVLFSLGDQNWPCCLYGVISFEANVSYDSPLKHFYQRHLCQGRFSSSESGSQSYSNSNDLWVYQEFLSVLARSRFLTIGSIRFSLGGLLAVSLDCVLFGHCDRVLSGPKTFHPAC